MKIIVPRYLLTNVQTQDRYEVEAHYAEEACRRLGWQLECCAFFVLRDDWTTNLAEPPLKLWNA